MSSQFLFMSKSTIFFSPLSNGGNTPSTAPITEREQFQQLVEDSSSGHVASKPHSPVPSTSSAPCKDSATENRKRKHKTDTEVMNAETQLLFYAKREHDMKMKHLEDEHSAKMEILQIERKFAIAKLRQVEQGMAEIYCDDKEEPCYVQLL